MTAPTVDQIDLLTRLQPLRRDIVSDGFDTAIAMIAAEFPIRVNEYATGTPCWTWTIPPKWTCDEAFVATLDGRRIIDQSANPLHIASYSEAMDRIVSREELLTHIHVHPHVETAIPFVFYYYDRTWAFSCSASARAQLTDDQYRVVIRSRFEHSTLKVGEYFLPGDSGEIFVLGTNLCHPLQVNDSLTGVSTALAVMTELARRPRRRYSYLHLITPENIGATAWLSHNEHRIKQMIGGLFIEMTGLDQPPALQHSFGGNSRVDKILGLVHRHAEAGAWEAPYRGIIGNDERQFNAPGVRVPMLSYSRALPWGHVHRPYREYHSDADNMTITHRAQLDKSAATVLQMIDALEVDCYPHPNFKGEPFLSGYNLSLDRFHHLTTIRDRLAILDYVDGTFSVADIAARLEMPFARVAEWIDMLAGVGLVTKSFQPAG